MDTEGILVFCGQGTYLGFWLLAWLLVEQGTSVRGVVGQNMVRMRGGIIREKLSRN